MGAEGEWKPMPGYPPKSRPSYGLTIDRLIGWALSPAPAYRWINGKPQWHARIGKVTPKREYIRYLVQRERDRRAMIAECNAPVARAAQNHSAKCAK